MNSPLIIPRYKRNALQVGVLLCLFGIMGRLVHLQLYHYQTLLAKSRKNFLRHETIWPQRGNILDCNGNLLVTNRPATDLYWQGTGNRPLTHEQLAILEIVQEIENKTFDDELLQLVKRAERMSTQQLIIDDITLEQLSKIAEQFPEHPNILIQNTFKRHYPYNDTACHVVGYINHLQDTGQMGIERVFDDALRGEHGTFVKTINSTGRPLSAYTLHNAIRGADVTTTINIDIQHMAEALFPPDESGTFIVMDPSNGAILTLVSRPTFDPTVFIEGLNQEEWQQLSEKKPFVNRALGACYPPASLFKMVTIAAALEEGIISTDTAWLCKGYIQFGRKTKCNKQHGWLDVKEAIAHSCNIPFYEIAKKLHIDKLAHYAQAFGLGQPTGILFPEKQGLVPTTKWKRAQLGERWWPGETLSASIGQSYTLVTPLQMARMISSICTHKLVRPRLLPQEPVEIKPLGISSVTCRFLQKGMREVVKEGKAKTLNTIDDLTVYAKTGTAQTCALDTGLEGKQYCAHAWLGGYFTYKNEKPLTIVIMIESAGSSSAATRVAKQFLVKYRNWKREQERVVA
ncbi:MAG: penicillin-binding transpeptidase domain-containing protein [Candidatus Babeliales bacterium]